MLCHKTLRVTPGDGCRRRNPSFSQIGHGHVAGSQRSEIFALDKKGRRSARPVYEASREEQNVGSHRRQFVTAPIRELAPGGYEFVLEVTDQANASTVTRTVRFVKDGKRKNA